MKGYSYKHKRKKRYFNSRLYEKAKLIVGKIQKNKTLSEEHKTHIGKSQKNFHKNYPKAGKEHSERLEKYYKDHPEARESAREKTLKFNEDHPEVVKERGKKIKKYYDDHPEAREKVSEKRIKHFKCQETRDQMRETKIKSYKEHPEIKKKISNSRTEYLYTILDPNQNIIMKNATFNECREKVKYYIDQRLFTTSDHRKIKIGKHKNFTVIRKLKDKAS